MNGDLISRQDAIEAFMTATGDGDKVDFCIDVLRGVPAIEPTTMGCENCTYHYPGEPYCSRMGIPVEDDFFCRDWEKGAKDGQ